MRKSPTGPRRSWLSRTLVVLCGVSFLQDAASEMLYPVLPLFLTGTLGAPVVVVGLVEGSAEGIASIAKVVAGRRADRFRRRPLIAIGYGLAAAGKAVIAVATGWPAVLAGRGIDRLGKGIRGAPRDALLMDGVQVSDRGKVFGFHRAADTAGAVVGPLIGLALYQLLDHQIRPLLVVAVVPAVASVLLVLAVREARTQPEPAPAIRMGTPTSASSGAAAQPGGLPTVFWRTALPLGVFSLVNFPDALLLIRAHALGLSVAQVIGVYVLYNAVYAAASYPAGALSDRWPPQRVIAAGLGCFALTYIGLGVVSDVRFVWPLFAVYGIFTAATDGVAKAWVSTTVPASLQGSAQGTFAGLSGAAVLIAGLWAGLAWGDSGRAPLIISGTISLIIGIALATRRSNPVTGIGRPVDAT